MSDRPIKRTLRGLSGGRRAKPVANGVRPPKVAEIVPVLGRRKARHAGADGGPGLLPRPTARHSQDGLQLREAHSIGFRSRLYFGRKQSVAPTVSTAARTAGLRCTDRCRANSAIRWRFVETVSNLGVLAIGPSNGSICRRPLPSTGSRRLDSPASSVSGRRRRPEGLASVRRSNGTCSFPHTAFTRVPGAER